MFALTPWRRTALLPRTEPFSLLAEEPFGRLFNRFFAEWPTITWPTEEMFEVPTRSLTMEETEREFVVRTELPGFAPEELTVELRGEVLVVAAEHKVPAETATETAERTYARVRRMITLPPEAELEKMEAIYRNGVLEVHVPRKPEPVGRRIAVRTETLVAPEAAPAVTTTAPAVTTTAPAAAEGPPRA